MTDHAYQIGERVLIDHERFGGGTCGRIIGLAKSAAGKWEVYSDAHQHYVYRDEDEMIPLKDDDD